MPAAIKKSKSPSYLKRNYLWLLPLICMVTSIFAIWVPSLMGVTGFWNYIPEGVQKWLVVLGMTLTGLGAYTTSTHAGRNYFYIAFGVFQLVVILTLFGVIE